MKHTLIALVLFAGSTSFAGQLNCWKTNFRDVKKPYMTAEIVADNKLKNIRFLYKNTEEKDIARTVVGKKIVTKHSPYLGNVRYDIGSDLILPGDLSNAALIRAEEKGIGYGKGENGVIIGSFSSGGDGAGNHYSTRLSCRSSR